MNAPSAFVGERADALLAEIEAGHSFKTACRRAGVSYNTFRYWMLRGGDPITASKQACDPELVVEPFATFVRRVRAAHAVGRRRVLPGRPRGRLPARIGPEAETAILDGLARGWSYHDACRGAGVRLSTFLGWLRLGGYPRTLTVARPLADAYVKDPYKSFVERVIDAESRAFGQI